MNETFRRGVLSLGMAALLLDFSTERADAQGTGAAQLPSNVVKQSRPYYVEGAVVVSLMAASVYAVCRSSRRV